MRSLRYYGIWTVLALAVLVTGYSAISLYRIERDNHTIARLNQGKGPVPDGAERAAPAIRLAAAGYLQQHGRSEEALELLGREIDRGDAALNITRLYNLGNLYLNKAMDAALDSRFDEAMAMTGLAKNAYRRVLALDSRHWDAKYNLEVAMRLLPEMERVNIEDEQETAKKSKPWTTIPGFPRGLP
ncbi:hypothetical protein [Methylomarinum vadi]|uniref:hypothetical protein n=1 Tax=Methylomarinum vadi TaxID=438855 RepID=UPI0004DF0FD8|nr:hypothetical protein [Methylomarinum vadi]